MPRQMSTTMAMHVTGTTQAEIDRRIAAAEVRYQADREAKSPQWRGTSTPLELARRDVYAELDDQAVAALAEQDREAMRRAAGERAEYALADRYWYALVTFGSPTYGRDPLPIGMPADQESADEPGLGVSAMRRLCYVADRAKGTGSCSNAEVVRCDTEAEARSADISQPLPRVYHA